MFFGLPAISLSSAFFSKQKAGEKETLRIPNLTILLKTQNRAAAKKRPLCLSYAVLY